ncbi:hypothetical protein [Streptomyces netropsis]|uniref:Uncharacterized protein n=1 Tax=Streptomyces netropsis TaxID=55404 RepID=A0A7W7LHR9_STRNE|nr:hypothetical protein [Streptomyces netropsis]MBB4890427.1 hypothetical protein [Streptomyces netropsis]GGR45993.1 hypothetical protein GCM10010219_59500 [Streptomyces netropsis]
MTTAISSAMLKQHAVAPADGPEGTAPLDVVAITRTVSAALRPVPDGATLNPRALADSITLLAGHIGLLLPIAECTHRLNRPAGAGPGLVGHGLAYVRRRTQYAPPNPADYPSCAYTWVQESARCVQQLLGLVLADNRERQHAAAAR